MRPPDDPGAVAASTFNMTPMIDVVFQLIIFLMLANDMSRRDIEDLDLPVAWNGVDDQGLEKRRVIVNLLRPERPGDPPDLRFRGERVDLAAFQRMIRPEADFEREAEPPCASGLHVLLRADRDARWQDVQWVMQALAEPQADLRIYKVQFATHDPRPDAVAERSEQGKEPDHGQEDR